MGEFIDNLDNLDVSALTSKEFLDELFNLDPTDRARTLIKIEARCQKVGLTKTAFERIYKAKEKEYNKLIKDMLHGNAEGQCRVLNFTDCPQLACGIWVTDDSGIYLDTPFGRVCACRHPIYPAEVYCNVHTNNFKIKLKYLLRGQWKEIIVDRETISTSTKIVSLSNKGIQVTSENAKYLVKYLNEVEALNSDVLVEKRSTSKFGWINEEFMPFADNIEFDNEDGLKPLFDSVTVKSGEYWEWLGEVMQIRQYKRIELQIYFAASLASVLIEPCGTLPFIVSLYGGTGLGKTVALMYAASVWGDPSEGGYISDAKSTPVALEVKLDCLNNMPLMIDDIAQVQNQYEGKFSNLIYAWCSGRGKERSNVKLGLQGYKSWRNCILTNGERSLAAETSQGGAVNRIIEIELVDALFEDGTRTAKVFRRNYGHFGETFVNTLMAMEVEEGETWQSKVSKEVEAILGELKEMSNVCGDEKEDKQLIPLAEILWADRYLERQFFHDGITIDIQKAFDLLKGKNEISEHRRCYEFIVTETASRHSHFLKDSETEPRDADVWGFYKKVDNQEKIVIFKTAFDKLIKEGGFQSKAFLGWAKANKLVELDGSKNPTKPTKWKNKTIRAVILTLPQYLETDEQGFIQIPEDITEDLPFD